ncbi:clock interacting protein circadian isoform X2 [Lycorma delicatula]|uniref:clock interacting protein circadian isoform X2 n=1 Tax=Lycorma delicatula TaxID=130591 RepID=UPI003F51303E
MAPTVCIAEPGEDRRVPFQLEAHLLALKTASGDNSRSLHNRRRLNRVLQLSSSKSGVPLMGLVFDESQQMITREGDSPGIPCSDSGSTSSSKSWTSNCSEERLLMLRRRETLWKITKSTMDLLRRNQQLQVRLSALQAETRAFVQSVLNNAENQKEVKKMDTKEEDESCETHQWWKLICWNK